VCVCVCVQVRACVHIHTFFDYVFCCKVLWVAGTVQLLVPCLYMYCKAVVVKQTILCSSRIRYCVVHPEQCHICLPG